jgi:hypothetical protein
MAIQNFNLKGKGSDQYFKETNLLRDQPHIGIETKPRVVAACRKIDNLLLPNIILNIPLRKIITMDWMEGVHLSQFKKSAITDKN